MLGITMHEIHQLLASLATLLVAIIGVFQFYHNLRDKKDRKLMATLMKDGLMELAKRAGPGKTQGIDIAFGDPSIAIRYPVILDEWVPLPWGLSVQGANFGHASTSYLLKCDNTARLLSHKHTGSEEVLVIKGEMVDLNTGVRYKPGETWVIPADTPHAVHFDAPPQLNESFMALVTVRPRLPYTSEVPLDLDALPKLLQRAR